MAKSGTLLDLLRRLLRIETLQLIVMIFELVGIPIAVWALLLTLEQTALTKLALEDQRAAAAWQILAIPGSGATGKTYALTALSQLGEPITGIKIVCPEERIGEYCENAPYLSDVSFVGAKEIFLSNFAGATMDRADFSDVRISASSLNYALLRDAKFEGTIFDRVSMFNAHLDGANFSGAKVYVLDLRRTDLSKVDFSGLRFLPLQRGSIHRYSMHINIGDATFCSMPYGTPAMRADNVAKTGKMYSCNPTVDQAFLDMVYFEPGETPKDLFLLPQHLTTRPACDVNTCDDVTNVQVSTLMPFYWRRDAR